MFKRRLNKAIAIVIAVATVATSALPASVYAAEFDNLVTVETEDAFETTEEVVGIVEDVTTDDQESSEAVEETEEEVIILDDFVSENAAFAALADGEYTFDALTLFQDATHDNGEESDFAYDDATKSVTVSFTKQFGQLIYDIPSELNGKIITKVTWNIEEVPAGADFATKLITDEADWWDGACEAGVQYGSLSASAKDDESGAKVKHVTLMTGSNCTATAEEPVTVTIKSITFEAKDAPVAGPVISEGEYTFDAITLFQDATHDNGEESDFAYDDATKSVTVSFTKQFGQLIYDIPSELNGKIITKVTWNIEEVPAGADFATKLITDEADWWDGACEAGVQYGSLSASAKDDESGAKVKHVTLMTGSNCTATAEEPVTVTIKSITFVAKEISAEPEKKDNEFTFNDLVSAEPGVEGAEISIDEETGELTVTMLKQYGQAFFRIPEKYDDDIIKSITWNLSAGSARDGITAKIHTEDNFKNDPQKSGDAACNYGSNTATVTDEELGRAARIMTIMTTADIKAGSPLVMKFKSVTINAKSSAREITDDIMANFNGNFESVGDWWNDGNDSNSEGANIAYVSYSDEDAAPADDCLGKYMKVIDPEAVGNADSQRPTVYLNADTGIACGKAYEFVFWARLDEEAGEVESPSVNLAIQMHPNNDWDNSVFAKVEFDKNNVLTSDWKRYSGTINLFDIGSAAMNESKISVYSEDGVVFDVDKLSIGQTNIKHVEENIPNFHEEVALKGIPMSGVAISSNTLNDELAMKLVFKHFNSISCENAMKPEVILGSAPKTPVDSVDDLDLHFEESEKTCDAIWKHNIETGDNIKMRGHVFVWHSQTPTWFFREGFQQNGAYVSKEVMNQRIDDYIRNVAEHYDEKYPGLIYAWDVVNEQASDGNGIRMGTDWSAVYGGSDEYIIQAFKSADLYLDEETILFYNDYNECTPNKCKQICKFLEKIKQNLSDGRKLGAGMQGHHDMATPDAATIEAAVRAYAAIADVVHVTELDIKSTMNFRDDTQEAIDAEAIANGQRYRQVYEILEKVNDEYGQKKVQCVTIWGTHDAVSWLKTSNSVGGSADGKTPQYPLIFDDYYQAKPAFWAIIDPNGEKYPDRVLPPLPEAPEKPNEVTIYDGIDADWIDLGVSNDGKVSAKAKIVVDEENNISVIIETTGDDSDGQVVVVSINGKEVTVRSDSDDENVIVEKIDGGYRYTINDLGELSGDNLLNIEVYGAPEYDLVYTTKVSSKEALVIPRGTIVVDGKVDSAWDLYAGDAHKLTVASAPSLAEGEVKYLWDEDNLYILMDVTDSIIDVTARDEYQQDSIEMFIDENNHKTGSYEDDDKQYRVSATNYQSFNNCVAANIKSEVISTPTGYLLEAALAWTDIEPENGTMIGLDIQINDAKNGSRTGTVNLFDSTGNGYQSTANYGTAILTGEDTEELNVQAIDAQVYTGKAIKPSVVVRQAGKKLIEGKDYTLSYKNNIKAAAIKGNGLGENFDATLPTVIITGKGNFKGKVMANFEISKVDFENPAGFEFVYKNNVVESKTATKPAVTVKYNGLTVAKTEYTVKYLQPASEGGYLEIESIPANEPDTYMISITANDNSNFVGTVTLDYVVVSKAVKNVSKLNITIPDNKLDYTGEDVMPAVVVKDGIKVVEADDETAGYTVEYADNVMPGTAKAIITGTGNYVGSVTKTFTIKGTAVSKLGITLSETKVDYSGVAIKPVVTVKDGTETLEEVESALANGYKLEYADNLMPGKATVTITGCGKYTGSVNKTFTINGKPVSKLSITVAGTGLYYNNGEEIKPEIVIKDGTETLEEVEDVLSNGYMLDFANNVMPGKATVTITGCGKYTGTVNKTFTINGFNFASAIIAKPENKPFNNKTYKTIELDVKYKVTSDEMVKFFSTEENPVAKNDIVTLDPKHYTVTLVSGGTNVGTATYKVTGNGIFTGSKNVSLTIDKVDAAVEESAISLSAIKDVRFVQGNNKPTVVVRADKRVLKSGVDYTVTYSNNSKVTDAAVATVTLKGNYKGKLTGTFKILPAIMNESYVATAKDVVATAKGAYKSTIVVTKPDGKKLTAKTDYDADIKYYIGSDEDEANLVTAANLADKKASLVAGTKMVAVITGKGNYEGSVKTSFYLVDAMATSASFKINDKVYTGRKIELTGDDFVTASVKVGGKVVNLEYGKDFDVKYLGDQKSYGTQKVEIIPKAGGSDAVALGGTKTVSFKVTPKDMKWSDEILFSIQNLLGLFD